MFRSLSIRCITIRNMSIFTQCLNPITGTATWEEKDQDYDYHQEVARSAFADMLHDHERNQKYYIALEAAIKNKHDAGQEANVLDIGTGTGLLSMMAAKCGADSITACEAFSPMAMCAVTIIKENGFADKIKLIHKRSTEMTVGKNGDMPKRANILVTEVFDTELIGEGALSTFHHAHETLLEKDSIVIPNSGTMWAQVVESKSVCAWNRIESISDTETQKILINAPLCIKSCSGAAAVHDIQLSRLPRDEFKPLLPPQPMFRFDWSGNTPLKYNDRMCLDVSPIDSGTAHAIFLWWDLNMDTEKKVLLSCAPVWEHPEIKKLPHNNVNFNELADVIPWRDHWMQTIYYLPSEVQISVNNNVSLVGYHDEYSFWFDIKNGPIIDIPNYDRPICSCCTHIAYSRTRIGQLNDKERNNKYIEALSKKVKPNTTCLCFSDGCFLGLAAAQLGAKKVYILETNFLSQKTIEMFIKTNNLEDKIEIISTDKLPPASMIDLIFGEPYFISSIVPWENLRFWYLASQYSSQVQKLPIAATIKAVAVEFKDLHKIRAPLGVCEGFDLSSFDKLVQESSDKSDSPVDAQPLWEYPARALTLPFTVKTFDLSTNVHDQKRIQISDDVPILQSGLCNGVALWVDWQLDSEISVSCGPTQEIVPGKRISWDRFTRQGVHIFRNIKNVSCTDILSWSFVFVPQHGTVEFQFKINTRKENKND
ncbi:protein arginine N-methyltransferase 7 isoform X2 [Vespa velutina]|uniref:protein arginine N-methyltransferase 7 isoform X2 n=2 Tax=Vespa velutina TaxID=202808 RepID=UPI001FB44313|nr:protein arginine N-methyltransferase 7 isoform X2 [Vespa velutina]XP_047371348.1 protein arginine N-methyltransferase 7 isoform X2 [Vespa velutina]